MPEGGSHAGLKFRERFASWLYSAWALAIGFTLLFSDHKFLKSAAWQRVIDSTPGGRTTVVMMILIAGVGCLAATALRARWAPWPFLLASSWCFGIAAFQIVAAIRDPTGPLGFYAWGLVSLLLLEHAFGLTKRFR